MVNCEKCEGIVESIKQLYQNLSLITEEGCLHQTFEIGTCER
jgi:hypothetical protein